MPLLVSPQQSTLGVFIADGTLLIITNVPVAKHATGLRIESRFGE